MKRGWIPSRQKAKRTATQSLEALNPKALMEFPRRAVNEGKGSSLLEWQTIDGENPNNTAVIGGSALQT